MLRILSFVFWNFFSWIFLIHNWLTLLLGSEDTHGYKFVYPWGTSAVILNLCIFPWNKNVCKEFKELMIPLRPISWFLDPRLRIAASSCGLWVVSLRRGWFCGCLGLKILAEDLDVEGNMESLKWPPEKVRKGLLSIHLVSRWGNRVRGGVCCPGSPQPLLGALYQPWLNGHCLSGSGTLGTIRVAANDLRWKTDPRLTSP